VIRVVTRLTTGFLVLAVLSGCSGGSGPKIAPASGRVTYKGKPLPNADVAFAPVDGSRAAQGRTDANGRFTLGTLATNDGAIVGKHQASVMAYGPDRPPKPGEGTGMPGETVHGDPVIPQKYFAKESSGLEYEVKSGRNFFEIELKD
jgi:hypothetical protein